MPAVTEKCLDKSLLMVLAMDPTEPTVFVVDDDDAARDSLKTLLELQFPKVVAFETCQEFLDAGAAKFGDCLVLDVHLPGISGFELMEILALRHMSLPTILITGRFDRAIRDRAMALGALTLLEKPIDFEAMMAAIRSCLAAPAR